MVGRIHRTPEISNLIRHPHRLVSGVQPHTITGAWGVDVSRQALSNGRTLYTLSGADWGQNLQAGASVHVGFNAMQGDSIGNEGPLTAEQLFANDPLLTWH